MKRIRNTILKKTVANILEFFNFRLIGLEHRESYSVLFIYDTRTKHWFPIQFEKKIGFWTAFRYFSKNRREIEFGMRELSVRRKKIDERLARLIIRNKQKRKR